MKRSLRSIRHYDSALSFRELSLAGKPRTRKPKRAKPAPSAPKQQKLYGVPSMGRKQLAKELAKTSRKWVYTTEVMIKQDRRTGTLTSSGGLYVRRALRA